MILLLDLLQQLGEVARQSLLGIIRKLYISQVPKLLSPSAILEEDILLLLHRPWMRTMSRSSIPIDLIVVQSDESPTPAQDLPHLLDLPVDRLFSH